MKYQVLAKIVKMANRILQYMCRRCCFDNQPKSEYVAILSCIQWNYCNCRDYQLFL